jgi:hypothetical protein
LAEFTHLGGLTGRDHVTAGLIDDTVELVVWANATI